VKKAEDFQKRVKCLKNQLESRKYCDQKLGHAIQALVETNICAKRNEVTISTQFSEA